MPARVLAQCLYMMKLFISRDGRQTWHPVDPDQAIPALSRSWKPETIFSRLVAGQALWTPFAEYAGTALPAKTLHR